MATMAERTVAQAAEEVWAALREVAERQKETERAHKETERMLKETSRQAAERHAETERALKESNRQVAERQKELERAHKETEKALEETNRQAAERHAETEKALKESAAQIKKTGKQLGKLHNRFGEVAEHMVVPNLVDKFRELDFEFSKAGSNLKFKDGKLGISTEVDAFLEDGDKVMAVETKIAPSAGDVDRHVARMEKLRKYADARGDGRKYFGAIAGVVIDKSVNDYILANGLYVVRPSGKTFDITVPEGEYRPREW
ncbi:MAG: hypothetical protein LBL31_01345 [Spirochaetaceae bacterium]|jgi:DNA repair exonuclease SbcCD ATPase subunit|nr:hypothetical protein [Spirochaetaceae bacterium]